MNALLRHYQDEYPEASVDELAMLARAVFLDSEAYMAEVDRLLKPSSHYVPSHRYKPSIK